jgi:hypothetical protein
LGNPESNQAIVRAANENFSLDALKEGHDVFGKGTSFQDVQRSAAAKAANPDELVAYQKGALTSLFESLDGVRGDYSAARQLFSKATANRAKLDAIFAGASNVLDKIQDEIAQRATEHEVIGNSRTASRIFGANALKPPEPNPVVSNAPALVGALTGGIPGAVAAKAATSALVMQRMNERPMRHLGLSRRELFEKIERTVLTALPPEDWELAEWRRARVNLDYHVEVHDFLYSVPHTLVRAEVEVRVTARIVEVFHRGQRVAVHQRRYMDRKHGTDPDHMPCSHRRCAEWTPDRFRRWAGKIGPNTESLISAVLASRPHPEQGFRTCLGILRSYRGIDAARLEAVSARAVELGVLNCKGVVALLARKPHDSTAKDGRSGTLFEHANLRGPGYYH